MSSLVTYKSHYLIPQDHQAASLAYVIQPNEYDYEGEAVIALVAEALWIAYPDRNYEVIPYQNIRETEVKDFRGITFEKEVYGKRVYVNPRDAWGIVVKFQQNGSYLYSITFLTFFANNAYEWKRKIEQAVSGWDRSIPSRLTPPDS